MQRVARLLACAWIVACCACAWALDPSHDISQYGHTAWRNLDGFGPGTVQPIAQTTDGYLWLGTPNGLLRFDGVTSVPWQPPAGSPLPDHRVRALLGTRDGALWIGTLRGLATLKDGKLVTRAALQGRYINALVEDNDGTVWVAGSDMRTAILCAIRGTTTDCTGEDGRYGPMIMSLHRDADGALWLAGRTRVWKLKPDPVVSYELPNAITTLGTLTSAPGGGVLVGTSGGVVRIAHETVEPYPVGTALSPAYFNKMMLDRNGALWMSVVEGGLLHVHAGRVDTFRTPDGLSGDQVYALFEDREGNVWASTRNGIDRFRPMAVPFYAQQQGVGGRTLAILAARDGSVFMGTSTGIYRLHGGEVEQVHASASYLLAEDRLGRIWTGTASTPLRPAELGYLERGRFVAIDMAVSGDNYAIAQSARGNVWVAQRDALLRVWPDGRIERRRWSELGDQGSAAALAADPVRGGIWVGFATGTIAHMLDGKPGPLIRLDPGDAVPHVVNNIRVDGDGTVWAATEGGLSRIVEGRVTRLDSTSGLPCDSVYSAVEAEDSVWLYMSCGLAQVPRADVDAWAKAAQRGDKATVHARLFDQWDGVRTDLFMNSIGQTPQTHSYGSRMARSGDGRIWLVTNDGASFVDPAHIPFNDIPPPVHIERVVGDGTPHEATASLELPPLLRNLEIDYTGLSLTLPEKVQFRYRLEGHDREWQEAGNRRRAFYNDLAPGQYRFHVIAANNSGVWNERGDTIAFSIAPAIWQTWPFRIACALAVALLAYALYRLRMDRVARDFYVTLDARVNERLRIARDLHDTLLQGFHGLLLGFQTALQLWPRKEGRDILEKTIDQTAAAITKGRDAVNGLRASATEVNDLAEAIRTLGETLVTEHEAQAAVGLSVAVQGEPRPLHPIVRDELFRIAAEALRNAFRHAQASRIEVEIRYDERNMILRVRDDGAGMERQALAQESGRGRFGLTGMRERAKLIGAKLTIWSAQGAGTEIDITVPAAHAYAPADSTPQPSLTIPEV
jgi:signal transduction histidine kinase/ligand-binding sensor domain-containing protein